MQLKSHHLGYDVNDKWNQSVVYDRLDLVRVSGSNIGDDPSRLLLYAVLLMSEQ